MKGDTGSESVGTDTAPLNGTAKKFANQITADIFDGVMSKKTCKVIPQDLHRSAQRKLTIVAAASSLEALTLPPGNRLEALQGDRQGQHSIRINDQYRICFVMTDEGATEIEIVDYH